METIPPDFEKLILRPPSEVEEAILKQNPLIAFVFLHPDHPGHLESEDVQAAVFEAEELAAAAGFGF